MYSGGMYQIEHIEDVVHLHIGWVVLHGEGGGVQQDDDEDDVLEELQMQDIRTTNELFCSQMMKKITSGHVKINCEKGQNPQSNFGSRRACHVTVSYGEL